MASRISEDFDPYDAYNMSKSGYLSDQDFAGADKKYLSGGNGKNFSNALEYYKWLYGDQNVTQEMVNGEKWYKLSDVARQNGPLAGRTPVSFNGPDDKLGGLVKAGIIGLAGAGLTGMLPGTENVFAAGGGSGAGGASALPESYWSAMADAGTGAASDAGAVGAGTFGGDFSLAGAGAGAGGTGLSAGSSALLTPELAAAGGFTAGAPTLATAGTGSAFSGLLDWKNLGSILGLAQGVIGAGAATSAANTQANAANQAAQTNLGMFNTVNAQQLPYRQAGYNALAQLSAGTGAGPAAGGIDVGQLTRPFTAADLKTNLAPNYQFQLDQGVGAVKNAANLTGGLYSGNTLKGINDYAQNYAGNAYQQAFNNYTTNQSNIFNRLASIAGLGQTANQATGNAAIQTGQNVGNAQVGAGAAQAAGQVGTANALSGGANNALGWYALSNIMGG